MTVEAEHLRSAIKPRRRLSAARRSVLHGLILVLVSLGAFFSYHVSTDFPFRHQQAGAIAGLSLPSVGPAQSGQSVLMSGVLPVTVRRQDVAGGSQAPQVAAQLPASTATPSQPFQLYTVAEGDTASAIASRFGIGLQYLLAANSDMRDGELLNVGQMLIVPPADGVLYHVLYGETLSDVAARYGVTVQDIINWGGNGIASPDQVSEGELVFVPGAIPPVSVLPEPEPVVAVSAPPSAAPPVAAADTGPTSDHGLIWPVTGPISSYYGPSHPLGIDIDLFATPWTDIHAATSGTVTFAGGDPCCSYGYHVIIMSPNGIETLYAHFSSIAVSAGQTVNQGDVLGVSGCTGYCTGNHLHFEVIDNGVRVDPLTYLP